MALTPAQTATLTEHLAAEAVHDAAAAARTYVEESFYENGALGLVFRGRDVVEAQYAASYDLISDLSAEYCWELQGDDYVVQAGRIRGRVEPGDMLGVPAAGGDMDFTFTAVIVFDGALMQGEHIFYDLGVFCSQAGIDRDALMPALEAMGSTLSGGAA